MFGLEGNDLEEKKHQNIEERAYKNSITSYQRKYYLFDG